MRILVVEDTEDLADAIVHRLRKLGHAVDWVTDGHEAEELLRQEQHLHARAVEDSGENKPDILISSASDL